MLFVFANSGLFLINLPTSIKLYSFSNKFVYISIGSHQRTKRVKTATELAADFHQVAARLWTHSRSWSLDPNSQFWRAMRSILSFSRGSQSAFNAGDLGSIPGWGRSPGEGNGNPLGYSWLENSIDRGDWQAIVHGVPRV